MVTNISNKSYLEAARTTQTRANRCVTDGRSAKAFHQRNNSITMSYIILDNQSIVDVLYNPTLLWNIRTSGKTLHLSCNAGTFPVNKVGDLPGYGKLWYHSKGITNILGLSSVAENDK